MRLEKLLCTHVQNNLGVLGNSKLEKKKKIKKKKKREVSCGCLYIQRCDNPISIRELIVHYNQNVELVQSNFSTEIEKQLKNVELKEEFGWVYNIK